MIRGNKVILNPIEEQDLKQLMYWRNLPEFRKHFREYRELSYENQLQWFKGLANDRSTIMFAIRNIEDGELIGCCGLCYINWVHRNADLSLYIGYEESYIDGKGFAEESCRLLFDYGFKELNLQKIWTEIYEFDHKKKTLYDQIGLIEDGFLRNQYFYNGKYWNSYILSILASEYIN